jgi:hypothetical protein
VAAGCLVTDLTIKIPVPQWVTIDQAKERMNRLLAAVRPEIPGGIQNFEQTWNGYVAQFSFEAKGYQIGGHLTVGHNEVVFDTMLPFMVNLFRSKIEEVVTRHATELLNAKGK